MKNIRDSYRTYKSMSENPIDVKSYVKLVNLFCKFIAKKVLEGEEVKLPSRTGTLSVKGKKPKIELDEDGKLMNHPVDYKSTFELWKSCPECKERRQKVYHLNEHSLGIRYKFFWSKKRVLVENKTFYTMRLTRTNKRRLAKLIKQGKEYYVEPNIENNGGKR